MNELDRQSTRVLVIDDSETARAAMSDTLREAGYRVLELPSAIGATRTILRHDIHAVVVDVTMPGLSGDMLVRLLRNNAKLHDLVIVVVSGMATADLESIRAEGGANAVLAKAEIQAALTRTLDRLISISPLKRADGARQSLPSVR